MQRQFLLGHRVAISQFAKILPWEMCRAVTRSTALYRVRTLNSDTVGLPHRRKLASPHCSYYCFINLKARSAALGRSQLVQFSQQVSWKSVNSFQSWNGARAQTHTYIHIHTHTHHPHRQEHKYKNTPSHRMWRWHKHTYFNVSLQCFPISEKTLLLRRLRGFTYLSVC
jgi:hypothetical protein